MNPVVSAMMCHALENRWMDKLLVDVVQPSLQKRAEALCGAIQAHLEPLGCSFHKPEGGYFVFLTFKEEAINTTDLLGIAMEKFKVKFTPGERYVWWCFLTKQTERIEYIDLLIVFSFVEIRRCFGGSNTMRLSFAFYDSAEMDQGIQRLKEAIEYYHSMGKN